jgi:hypothetical protein
LGFLGCGRFGAKAPKSGYWIVLDFLGFSRQNRDFSMGYGEFSGKKISRALLRWRGGAGTGARGPDMQRMVHGPSVLRFLIFCKRLSSDRNCLNAREIVLLPFAFGRLDPLGSRQAIVSSGGERAYASRLVGPEIATKLPF